MDWEYPALRGGAAADKANFVLLLKVGSTFVIERYTYGNMGFQTSGVI